VSTDSSSYNKEVLGNYLALRYGGDYKLVGNIIPNADMKGAYVENLFVDKTHSHYYKPLKPEEQVMAGNASELFFRTKKEQLDLYRAIDVILFDNSQSDITFRGN
jgi:hypothetical protein